MTHLLNNSSRKQKKICPSYRFSITPDAAALDDPVLGPKIKAIRQELGNRADNSPNRESLLVHALAVSQVNHENAQIARLIFGSQIEILLHLNARSEGDTLANVGAFYERARHDFPSTYSSYSFEQYLGFLEMRQLITRENQQIRITPRAKALLHYLVAAGDTLPRPN